MSAAYLHEHSGSNMTNDTPPTYLGNPGSPLNSFASKISYEIPNPDISNLLPAPPDHDSGIYDMEPVVQSSEAQVIKLAEWQDNMLRLWATENRRAASDREMLSFHILLQLSEGVIKARLGQLFEEYGVLHCSIGEGGAIQNSYECFVDNTQAMMNSFGTETDTSEATTMFQNMDTFQDISQSFDQQVSANESTMHQSGTSQSYQPQVLSNRHTSSSMARVPTAAYGINGTINTTNGYFSAHGPSHQISTAAYPFTHVHQNQPLVVTKALLVLIQTVVNDRIVHGCGPIRSHEIQTGKYPCTLGCGRRFKTSCDLFRHEAIVYPQNWYFCFMCGDVNKPLEKYLFTREDKMRRHCKDYHPNNITIGAYKVANALSTFPERCTLCSHYRHRNWKDRCKHIIWHCKRGDDFGTTKDKGKGVNDIPPSGQDDDSDDNDDDDEDNNHSDDDNEENGDDQSNPRDLKDEDGADDFLSDDYQYDGDGDQGPSSGRQVDSSMDIFDWDSFDSLNFPKTISLKRLTTTEEGSAELSSEHLDIQWLDRVNKKGGTASVFKVALSTDPVTGRSGEARFYAVKQYSAQHRACYDQEVEALTRLFIEDKDSLYTVRCYGTFQYLDQRGQPTLNLLLEYAESDLREYFADAPQPTTAEEILSFWESISSIAQGLQLIHNFSNHEEKSSSAAHMDLKPDNILVVNGTFKLADFGFSRFDKETIGPHVQGGTTAYGAPEVQRSPTSQKYHLITSASDIWSFGCMLSEAATWVVLGFQGLRSLEKRCQATSTNAKKNSCFHNGKTLKPEILKWHYYLQSATRGKDIIVARVVDMISDHLLQENPALRLTARELVDSIAQILSDARCLAQAASCSMELPESTPFSDLAPNDSQSQQHQDIDIEHDSTSSHMQEQSDSNNRAKKNHNLRNKNRNGRQSSPYDPERKQSVLVLDDAGGCQRSNMIDRLNQEMNQFLSGRQEQKIIIHFATVWGWSTDEEAKLWSLLWRFSFCLWRRLQRDRFQIHIRLDCEREHQDHMFYKIAQRFPFVTVLTTPPRTRNQISSPGNKPLICRKRSLTSFDKGSSRNHVLVMDNSLVMGDIGQLCFTENLTPGLAVQGARQTRGTSIFRTLGFTHDTSEPLIPGECDGRISMLLVTPDLDHTSRFDDEVLRRFSGGLTAQLPIFLERINFARLWQNDLYNHLYRNHPAHEKDRGRYSHSHSRKNTNRYIRHGRVSTRRHCTVGTKDRNGHVSMRLSYQHVLRWIIEDDFSFTAREWWESGLRRPTVWLESQSKQLKGSLGNNPSSHVMDSSLWVFLATNRFETR